MSEVSIQDLVQETMSEQLSEQEWKVLRDAKKFTGYFWAPKTCQKLTAKGLMRQNSFTKGYALTDDGFALLNKSDELQRAILATE